MSDALPVFTFDCYGTLIDWEAGIGRALVAAAHADGIAVTPAQVLAWHAEIEPAVQARGYQSYRGVLTDVALEIARRCRWPLSSERAGFLAESVATWNPFPDTNPALERLARTGHPLGILSNIDDDIIARTLQHFTVPFAYVVTAQQVRAYKPAHHHFEWARRSIGERPWIHVAQSYFHDVEPAVALGIPVVWINRKGETRSGAAVPAAEFRTLAEFAEAYGQ